MTSLSLPTSQLTGIVTASLPATTLPSASLSAPVSLSSDPICLFIGGLPASITRLGQLSNGNPMYSTYCVGHNTADTADTTVATLTTSGLATHVTSSGKPNAASTGGPQGPKPISTFFSGLAVGGTAPDSKVLGLLAVVGAWVFGALEMVGI